MSRNNIINVEAPNWKLTYAPELIGEYLVDFRKRYPIDNPDGSMVIVPVKVEEKGTWKVVMQDDTSILVMCDVPTNGIIPSDQERHVISGTISALMSSIYEPDDLQAHNKLLAKIDDARALMQKESEG